MVDGRLNYELDQLFRLRPRYERPSIAFVDAAAKFHCSEEMLKRLALAALPNELAQRRELCFIQRPLKLQIKLDPFPPQHTRWDSRHLPESL